MKRRFSLFVAVLLIGLFVVALPLAAKGDAEKKDKFTVGVVIPYQIGWFSAFHQGFSVVAETEDVKIVWQYHNYSPDEEAKAVENLITLGVDAINVTAATPESAQYSCRLANDAGIPIQVTESGVAPGPGKPFADIDFDWYQIYQTVAKELRAAEVGDLNVLMLQGFLGSPPVMLGIKGFEDAIATLPGMRLAAPVQEGEYATEPSLNITKGMVQGGINFNVAIGSSQEIVEGIIQGLKEERISLDDVAIVTVNGGPQDVVNLKDGEIDYVLSQSPGLHGMICAQNLINMLKGKTYQTKLYSPIVWTTQAKWEQELIPWDMSTAWLPLVNNFVETGVFNEALKP